MDLPNSHRKSIVEQFRLKKTVVYVHYFSTNCRFSDE